MPPKLFQEFFVLALTMTSSGAHAVPWHAVIQFHREVLRHCADPFFALPITPSGAEHWSPLAGFEPGKLAGPWEIDFQALESTHLQRQARAGLGEAYVGGPCWFRWSCEDEQGGNLEWIPLIYREVTVQDRGERLGIVPVQDGWDICPLVYQFLAQHNIQTLAPLDEMLPELLSRAESKAIEDGHGLTRTLAEAFRLVAPELGKVLVQARKGFPTDRAAYVPSPWVLFSASPQHPSTNQPTLHDYARLERQLAAAGQDMGGLALLDDAPTMPAQAAPEMAPVAPLDGAQRRAVEAALAGRPVAVINAPAAGGMDEVLVSILLNAWANSTTVLLASSNSQAIEQVRERLSAFERDFDIAIHAGEQQLDTVETALGRSIDMITARRGESHYGGSLSDHKRGQLIKKKQRLGEMLDSQVPQRLSQAIEAALASHAAQRQALSALASRREELVGKLRDLGVDDAPDTFDERVIAPLRKWRNGIDATRRLIKEDAQRVASLQKELCAARAERDSALDVCQIDTGSDEALSWLLAEPGFSSFEQALGALSEKLQEPVEDELADATWDKAFDAWSSSEAATDWERQAREMAFLIRPAGIALKEKADEVRAAHEALDAAQRKVQEAIKSSSLDVKREDLNEWAACYAELGALPRAKIAFLSKSKSAELIHQLEKIESRLRISLPVHLWTSIGALNETGRTRLSAVIERGREWFDAREHWENLGSVRDEIEAETDGLRRRLDALGAGSLSAEVTPTACTAIAAKLNEMAAAAATAAAAWSKRETRERLPAELAELATQIRASGSGTPIKERWMKGAGAALIAALDSVARNPGAETITAVRNEVLGPVAADPIVESWRRASEAEKERIAIDEEMERIPPCTARLSHWKTRRPASLPAGIDDADAFDGDDSHALWAFLHECEEWSQTWTHYCNERAPAHEQTANSEGANAIARIREACAILPKSKEKAWLEALAGSSAVNEPWPVENITKIAKLWRPERLQAEIEAVDAQLERMTFETAREQWLDRVARDADVLPSLNALRDHFKQHRQPIDESSYPNFEQALKAQPVWITDSASAQVIPMQPGLFDLLVIDQATQCTLTEMLPLIFRAKRLVVIGDPQQPSSIECLDAETEQGLVERFGVEQWSELLGHSGNTVYKAAAGTLPRDKEDIIFVADQ